MTNNKLRLLMGSAVLLWMFTTTASGQMVGRNRYNHRGFQPAPAGNDMGALPSGRAWTLLFPTHILDERGAGAQVLHSIRGAELDEFAAKDQLSHGDNHPKTGAATVEDATECVDHIVKVAGIDHVGIGSDFDGINSVPQGLEDVSKMPALTAALLKRGYKEQDIRKIMGGNFLRVMKKLWGTRAAFIDGLYQGTPSGIP